MSTDLKEKKTETAGEINARDAYPYRFLGAINSPGGPAEAFQRGSAPARG